MKRGKVVWLFASYYHRIIGLVVYEQIVGLLTQNLLKSSDKNSFPCCFTISIFFQKIQTMKLSTMFKLQTLCPFNLNLL